MELLIFSLFFRSFSSVLFLLRPRRIAVSNRLGTGLGTTTKGVRCSTSGFAGNGLGTTIKKTSTNKERRRGQHNGIGTTIKYL
jgi:hypothetical protein